MNYPKNYVPDFVYYHVHSMLSNGTTNIDSVTDYHDLVDAIAGFGCKSMAISEHGNLFGWYKKKQAIEAAGMKYIHAVEAYLTEKADAINRVRDNYHCVLIAKNYEGFKELNKLTSKSFNRHDGHFYYAPRITFEELVNTSDNILVTTACLGGVLNSSDEMARQAMIAFLANNKHRCWLEIQHHNTPEQIAYNRYLYEVSKAIDVPLIVGTDTHTLNEDQAKARLILQKAKGVHFGSEDKWNLVLMSPAGIVKAYEKQDSLPMDIVFDAMSETVRMAEMVEEYKIDSSPKYPKLYSDSEGTFKKKINEGTIRRGIHKLPNRQEYYDRIHYEYDTYVHNKAVDFMLLEEDYKSEMRRRGIRFGYSRGSVSGSVIAYLLGITEIDSVKYNLNFERFMNKERVSLAD